MWNSNHSFTLLWSGDIEVSIQGIINLKQGVCQANVLSKGLGKHLLPSSLQLLAEFTLKSLILTGCPPGAASEDCLCSFPSTFSHSWYKLQRIPRLSHASCLSNYSLTPKLRCKPGVYVAHICCHVWPDKLLHLLSWFENFIVSSKSVHCST